jgi:hypothetical protein
MAHSLQAQFERWLHMWKTYSRQLTQLWIWAMRTARHLFGDWKLFEIEKTILNISQMKSIMNAIMKE